MRRGAVFAFVALVLVGCGGSPETTETFVVRDANGATHELIVTRTGSEECFALDGGGSGEWCGEPLEDVTTVDVIGSAGSGIQSVGEAEAVFDYAVVGVAPLDTDYVRVSLDDSAQLVAATAGERYSAWVAVFEETVSSDGPLHTPPQPAISAKAAG